MKSIYSTNFLLVCISSLFFSSSFNMLIPELPSYLSSLGGAEYKGLIIALFTLTAGISRPFSGKLTDTIGRIPVLIIGAVVCVICGFLYPVLSSVSGFLFLRLIHGFSTGFTPTAISAYVADSIPKERWGEALGIQGLFFSTGFALGPALGSYLKLNVSFEMLFYASSFMALFSILLVLKLKETLVDKQPFSLAAIKITKKDIVEKRVLPAAIIVFLGYIALGVILTLIPDWSEHLGLKNKGIFFIVFTVFSLLVRFIAGKSSDKYGRSIVIKIGLVIVFIALVLLGLMKTSTGMLVAAAFYGLGMGILSPTLNAWTIDLSNPKYRGKAMATMYIALEAGIGLGALLSGWYYQDIITKVPTIFFICAVLVAFAFVLMLSRLKERKIIPNFTKN